MNGFSTHLNDPALEPFARVLPAALAAGACARREAAFEKFCAAGVPHRKLEAWKYTDVSRALAGPFVWADDLRISVRAPDGVRVLPLAEADFPPLENEHPFALLNRTFSNGGRQVVIPDGVVADQPVELVFESDIPEALDFPVVVIDAGAGCRVDIVLRFEGGAAGSLAGPVIALNVGKNAVVSLTKIRHGGGSHFSLLQSRQAADSRLSLFDFTGSGSLTRNDLHAVLAGEGAEIDMNGLYVVDGAELADNHTTVEHAVPQTRSRQLYKGMIGGRAAGVFNGRVVVNPGAFGTDALQMNRNLLRSRSAKIDTKPQLEIANDDVRCSHGATIGRLDEAQIFYLKSRGLDPVAAESLLARGFAGEVIAQVKQPAVRAILQQFTDHFFSRVEREE